MNDLCTSTGESASPHCNTDINYRDFDLQENLVVVLNRWCKYIMTLMIHVLRKLNIEVMHHENITCRFA